MIVTAILNFLYAVISFFIGLLPDSAGLPVAVTDSFTYFVSSLKAFEFVLPVDTLFTVFGYAMVFYMALFLWRGLHWVYNKIRGS